MNIHSQPLLAKWTPRVKLFFIFFLKKGPLLIPEQIDKMGQPHTPFRTMNRAPVD